jgi:hypothetical protein
VGNIWSHQSKILAADGAAYDEFGVDASLFGTTTMIGAFEEATGAGITYI